jgi:membrane fusion protein, adhesin transport system
MNNATKLLPPGRGNRSLTSLDVAPSISDAGSTKLIRFGIFVVALTMVLFISWSAVTEVNETAVTVGAVVPAGNVVPIQHLEGGIIEQTLVKEGDIVEIGQPIVRMAASAAQADLERMGARLIALSLEEERLRALAESRPPQFLAVPAKFQPLVDDQQDILASQIEARDKSKDVLASRVREIEAQIETAQQDMKNAQHVATLLEKEMKIRAELTEKGLSPRVTLLATQIKLAEAKGRSERLGNEQAQLRESLHESRQELDEFLSQFRSDSLADAGSVAGQRVEVEEMIESLTDRVNRLDVVSPVRGIVQSLPVKNIGTVLAPGGLIAEIVPVDGALVVENRISPRDVGFVQLGQAVDVKVHTFDFTRLGAVPGELAYVSATTFLDENQEPYYQGRVILKKSYVGENNEKNKLLPGMTVQADIQTGRKTILQYLLKPIYTNIDQAMSER